MFYRLLKRSTLDYGCKGYNSENSREITSLESVSNKTVKISKSTTKPSLKVITENPPVQLTRDNLSLNITTIWKINYKIPLSISSLQNKKPYTRIIFISFRSQSDSTKYIPN